MIESPYLIINRTRELELQPFKSSVRGRFKLVKRHESGVTIQETPWFDNLITDAGLNRWGTIGYHSAISIGTGTSTPLVTDLALAAFAARTTNAPNLETSGNFGSPDYIAWRTIMYRFPFGSLNGNYTEVSVDQHLGGATYGIFSRALILDGLGAPTSITVLPNESLDVYYQLQRVPVLTDLISTITIGATVHDTVTRVSQVQNSAVPPGTQTCVEYSSFGTKPVITSGVGADISAITAKPSGTTSTVYYGADYAYVNNSLERTGYIELNQAGPNPVAGNFKTLFWSNVNNDINGYQVSFDPVVPKDNTRRIVFYAKATWARV